jgi:hypothetical protein
VGLDNENGDRDGSKEEGDTAVVRKMSMLPDLSVGGIR